MKQCELSRELKSKIWHRLDAGSSPEQLAESLRLPIEAVAKQHRLWSEYRTRNPKRK
jgi:hypothetical protein